jgi:hypothetical protein
VQFWANCFGKLLSIFPLELLSSNRESPILGRSVVVLIGFSRADNARFQCTLQLFFDIAGHHRDPVSNGFLLRSVIASLRGSYPVDFQ